MTTEIQTYVPKDLANIVTSYLLPSHHEIKIIWADVMSELTNLCSGLAWEMWMAGFHDTDDVNE